jgi:hypothetical protein
MADSVFWRSWQHYTSNSGLVRREWYTTNGTNTTLAGAKTLIRGFAGLRTADGIPHCR